MSAIQTLLLQIAVILLLSRVMGRLMRFIGQPQVIGEIVAGIMLGPSLLGLIDHGAWMNALFPAPLMGSLDVLSQLGIVLFMFTVGLQLDPSHLRGQGKTALVTGTVGIIVPFVCGVALAFALFAIPELQPARPVSLMVLGPFIGAAMSITAFPVLARILTEWDMHKTAPGALALTCAAMEDFLG